MPDESEKLRLLELFNVAGKVGQINVNPFLSTEFVHGINIDYLEYIKLGLPATQMISDEDTVVRVFLN